MRPSRKIIPSPDSKEKAETMLRAALSKKALAPVIIRLDRLTALTDYFLIVSGRSNRQVKAIAEAVMEDSRKRKYERFSSEGVSQGKWALLDYGDVIVHIFHTPVREFYDLEGLWAEAPRMEFSEDLSKEILAASETSGDEDDYEDDFRMDRTSRDPWAQT